MAFVIDPDLLGLVDNVALVTGGGGVGMGRSHCVQLARAGCHIVVSDINEEGGQKTVEEVKKLGREAIFVKANVRKKDEIDNLVNQAFERFGRLDVAVNHVGDMTPGKSFLDYTEEAWDHVVNGSLKVTLMCAQSEALAMIKNGIAGRIINVGSMSGVNGSPNVSAYGAAKAAVHQLTKSLALELAPYNIRVNCIIPASVINDAVKKQIADPATPDYIKKFWEAAAKAQPMGRLGEPWETAGLAVFFASKLSSYVTGHSLLSDGGLGHTTARPAPPLGPPEALKDFLAKKKK
ncbi:MAG: SDR family NAD(P)-dependent oxidoreductase [Dehalococcoidia bacterium]